MIKMRLALLAAISASIGLGYGCFLGVIGSGPPENLVNKISFLLFFLGVFTSIATLLSGLLLFGFSFFRIETDASGQLNYDANAAPWRWVTGGRHLSLCRLFWKTVGVLGFCIVMCLTGVVFVTVLFFDTLYVATTLTVSVLVVAAVFAVTKGRFSRVSRAAFAGGLLLLAVALLAVHRMYSAELSFQEAIVQLASGIGWIVAGLLVVCVAFAVGSALMWLAIIALRKVLPDFRKTLLFRLLTAVKDNSCPILAPRDNVRP